VEKIFQFYENMGLPLHLIVQNGERQGIPKEKIMTAAISVRRRLLAGEVIEPIRIARVIWKLAKEAEGDEFRKAFALIRQRKKEIRQWRKRFFVACGFLAAACALLVAMGLSDQFARFLLG
jgi:hypothetical protein